MKTTGTFAILSKEFLHMVRDPATILFSMLPPIFQVIAFGFAIDTDVRNVSTVVYNQDLRQASREVIHELESTGVFKITGYVHSEKELFDSLLTGHAVVAVEFPPDFTGRRDLKRPASIGVFIDGTNNTIALQAMSTARGLGLSSQAELIPINPAEPNIRAPIDVRPRVLFNPDLKSPHFFVPGIIGVAIQLSLTMLVAFAIVREREIGTLEQLMVSPATRFAMLLGKIVPYVVLAIIEMLILILIMIFVFQIPIQGSAVLLFALSGIFAIAVIGIGLLISTAASSQVQATQMAIATLLPSIFLSGFIYPRETMPDIFYAISFLLPLTYFLEILRGIVLRGAALRNLLHAVYPLSIMAVGLFTLSVMKFQKRLD